MTVSAETEKPLVYVILGAAGSGRREVLADLIANGLPEDARAAVLLSADETADAHEASLGATTRWHWRDGKVDASLPDGATHVFFVTDGRVNPVDQIEQLHGWITAAGGELARVITVVHCRLGERHGALLAWHEACIHFSDIVLLGRREEVANKWMSDFQAHFKKLFYPCLFEVVKAGRVKNPLAALQPQARRMSHLFDIDEWTGINIEGIEFGTEDEGEEGEEEAPAKKGNVREPKPGKKKGHKNESPEDDDDWKPEVDAYLLRRPDGRREKEIPDIAKYLGDS